MSEKSKELKRAYLTLCMNVGEHTAEEGKFIKNVENGMSYGRAARKAHYKLPKGDEPPFYLSSDGDIAMWLGTIIKICSAVIAFLIVYALKMDFTFVTCLIAVGIYLLISYLTIGVILVKSGAIKDPVEKLKEDVAKETDNE